MVKGQWGHNIPLARFTSWRLGGPAAQLYIPDSVEGLSRFLLTQQSNVPLLLLGLGSNTLVRDGGFPGTVVVFSGSGLNALSRVETNIICAQAGVSCATLARFGARHNLGGLAFLAGIPGTVGGALAMNAGAHDGEIWNHVQSVDTIDMQGIQHRRARSEFRAHYRQVEGPPNEWFVAANLEHTKMNKAVALAQIKSILAHRKQTQPSNRPSGGSVFKNPTGDYAARLIESCGLKGYRHGASWVSEKHANFIVHNGEGCAKEVEDLIQLCQKTVADRTSILLEPEVKVVGCELPIFNESTSA